MATGIIERTRKLQPHGGDPLTGEAREQAVERSKMMSGGMARGVSPDAVGKMVLEALLENRSTSTHRIMTGAIEARTRFLLDAMPAEEGAKVSRPYAFNSTDPPNGPSDSPMSAISSTRTHQSELAVGADDALLA